MSAEKRLYQHSVQSEAPRIPEIINTNRHTKMVSGGLVAVGVEQTIPPWQVEAEVAVCFPANGEVVKW